jgi:hypothetical protein
MNPAQMEEPVPFETAGYPAQRHAKDKYVLATELGDIPTEWPKRYPQNALWTQKTIAEILRDIPL